MNDFEAKLAFYQNPIAFGLLPCRRGVPSTVVSPSMSGETTELHKSLGKSETVESFSLEESYADAPGRGLSFG